MEYKFVWDIFSDKPVTSFVLTIWNINKSLAICVGVNVVCFVLTIWNINISTVLPSSSEQVSFVLTIWNIN